MVMAAETKSRIPHLTEIREPPTCPLMIRDETAQMRAARRLRENSPMDAEAQQIDRWIESADTQQYREALRQVHGLEPSVDEGRLPEF